MGVKIIDRIYENQFKPSSTTNWLLGNVGDWQRLTLDCRFAVEKVFTPFFSTRKEEGGSGIGMYIVYTLITERLDGYIECTSEIGGGVKFIIRIPLKEGDYEYR